MFYYFGRKGRLAGLYPAPRHPLVIEPFAGSMAYTLHWRPDCALGMEIDENVYNVWKRVCSMSSAEISDYVEPALGERVSDRWQMMTAGSHGTCMASSYLWTDRMARDFRKQKRLAARHVEYAAGIDYRLGSYEELENVECTWFIDPPYQGVHRGYCRDLDYGRLGEWCRSRRGQVIVCEQRGADWLPFVELAEIRGTVNRRSVEVVWAGG